MTFAYPDGPSSVPAKKLPYYDIPSGAAPDAFLPPAACALGLCEELRGDAGVNCGYELRLGSSAFPHLKLRLQVVQHGDQPVWIYMVNTHDAFSKQTRFPPPDHPDAKKWMLLQTANRHLKQRIEEEFEKNGLTTFNSLLRDELKA